ncbi:MAG: hypothetical protein AAFS10_22400, partial [Myxococcota bacterium]
MTTSSLGQILVARGVLSAVALEQAVRLKDLQGGSLAVNLVLAGVMDDKTLATFYQHHFGLPRVTEQQLSRVTREIFNLIPVEIIYDAGILPLAVHPDQGQLAVGVIDPTEKASLDEAAFFAAHDLTPHVMSIGQIARHYLRLTGKRWRIDWETVQARRRALWLQSQPKSQQTKRIVRIVEPIVEEAA